MHCDITTNRRGKQRELQPRVSTFITSGDESAQRATSDVHLFPQVMYLCNNKPQRGGVLIIHTFTTWLQYQWKWTIFGQKQFFGEIAIHSYNIYTSWDEKDKESGVYLPSLVISLLTVVYCFAYCCVLLLLGVVYCKIHNSYFVVQTWWNVVDYRIPLIVAASKKMVHQPYICRAEKLRITYSKFCAMHCTTYAQGWCTIFFACIWKWSSQKTKLTLLY